MSITSAWTKDENKQLKRMYPNNPTRAVAVVLGRSEGAVKKRAKRLGLKKTSKHLKSLGRKA